MNEYVTQVKSFAIKEIVDTFGFSKKFITFYVAYYMVKKVTFTLLIKPNLFFWAFRIRL